MQSLGHPLVGDPVYGGKRRGESKAIGLRRQALHAARLEFSHPISGARRRFTAPPPEDLRALLDSLE
jgi:23S rRNA-/tRNA-specific pseudouridylate synthase